MKQYERPNSVEYVSKYLIVNVADQPTHLIRLLYEFPAFVNN